MVVQPEDRGDEPDADHLEEDAAEEEEQRREEGDGGLHLGRPVPVGRRAREHGQHQHGPQRRHQPPVPRRGHVLEVVGGHVRERRRAQPSSSAPVEDRHGHGCCCWWVAVVEEMFLFFFFSLFTCFGIFLFFFISVGVRREKE